MPKDPYSLEIPAYLVRPGERMERAGGDAPEAGEEKGADDAGEPELRCAPEIPYLSAGRPLFCASMLFVPTYR